MSNKRITQLPIGEITLQTIIPIVTSGITSQTTFNNFINSLNPYFSAETIIEYWTSGTGLNAIVTVNSDNIANGINSIAMGSGNTVNGNYSFVLGRGITGTTDDTTYVDNLNIKTVSTGTSVNTLGIDSSGNVIASSFDIVSATGSGIVNNVSLQELGGVDKLINGIRIGRGNNNLAGNTVLGSFALISATTGSYNTGIGTQVMGSLLSGSYNTGVGSFAMYSNNSSYNTGVGTSALQNNTGGTYSTSIGAFSLASSNANHNTGIGTYSLNSVTTGERNTAVGSFAGYYAIGSFNTAIGQGAGSSVTVGATGSNNITLGFQAGRDLTSGSNNILIENITNASITTGSFNIIIDPRQKAGVTTGSNNVLIGGWDGAFSSSLSDTIALGTGGGVTRFLSNTTGTTLPQQTIALISGETTGKVIVTREYIPTGISDNIATYTGTSGLTSATLTSTYPTAITGFKVHGLSISGGGQIYEKTSTGWCNYAATITA